MNFSPLARGIKLRVVSQRGARFVTSFALEKSAVARRLVAHLPRMQKDPPEWRHKRFPSCRPDSYRAAAGESSSFGPAVDESPIHCIQSVKRGDTRGSVPQGRTSWLGCALEHYGQ